ncbi:MAG: hypothetical protein OIN66_03235 [Candidatus Methanoperedens sp.]|nr:hypothetical protein [Candidatus Methanoperedens sp.]
MKFAEKCPKCGGDVQTKNLKKAIGLGFVDIPVSQFCLNPRCDWYQDFSEAKKAEEIKEGVIQIKVPSIKGKIPEIRKPHFQTPGIIQRFIHRKKKGRNILVLGGVIVYILILIFYLIPQYTQSKDIGANATGTNVSEADTTRIPVEDPAGTDAAATVEGQSHTIKIDVAHGFVPLIKVDGRADNGYIIINRSDTIIWTNEENQRSRVYLVSREGLFENRRMQYMDRFSYQFNTSGDYTFTLAEYPSLKEYNATGRVTVR